MRNITIPSLKHNGEFFVIKAEEVADYLDDAVRVWSFECEPYTGDVAIQVGRDLNLLGLGPSSDRAAVEAARGKSIMVQVCKGWDRTDDAGNPLAINAQTVGTLPVEVLRNFGVLIEYGSFPSTEELAALKKPKTPSLKSADEGTANTSKAEE